ncbi:MAG: hypothetical protein ACRDN0_01425 [Trebonia sp.]
MTLGPDEMLALALDETLGLGLGDELALGPAETLALRVGKMLDIALWVLSHPATMHPMARIAAKRTKPLVKRRMPDPSARPLSQQAAPAAPRTNDPAGRATWASPVRGELGRPG